MAISKNEAQSRIQINKMLELSGWDLDIDSEKRNVEVEYPTPSGREADYVLLDKNGFPLCVLEAKNFEIDPLIAKEQARAVLPEGLTESTLYMNGTLRSWMHYIDLRTANGTQREHMEIAGECAKAIEPIFPMIKEFNHLEGTN